jgi:SAM-dependent methyltransferase
MGEIGSESFSGERVFPEMVTFRNTVAIWTGETHLPPHVVKKLWDEHKKRYTDFARPFCQEKDVLDIACGTAYGKNLIGAKKYVGVDIHIPTLKRAAEKGLVAGESLVAADARNVPFAPNSFDTVISFETIEHIPFDHVDQFLSNVCAVLRSNGTFLVSTPNRPASGPETDSPRNKFHYFEMDRDELREVLKRHFVDVALFGQALKPDKPEGPAIFRKIDTLRRVLSGKASEISPEEDIGKGTTPNYWLAICKKPIKLQGIDQVIFERVEVPPLETISK